MLKKNLPVIVLFFIILLLITIGKIKQQHLQKTMIITNGTIYKTAIGNKGWLNIYYKFTVGNEEFKAGKTSDLNSKYYSFLMDKSFPVIYSSENVNHNFMLISPRDFKKYNIQFPDSLLWVKELAK